MQATAQPVRGGARSPWIVDPRRDLAFFVATPLLIVPLVALARSQWSIAEIGLYVAAFGATGHHLPGLLRAYGDRELFRRFRARFVAAPIFLTACCVGLANTDLDALAVIVLLWGTWHGLAQVFGVLRIYDVKVGSMSASTVQLDRWMCIAWFGAGLVYSPPRMAAALETFYAAGVPLVSPGAIHAFQTSWGVGTGLVTLAFAANFVTRWRQGTPASPIKLPLMISSFGFWWYAMVWIDNAILGIALFELFHDVQYLAIAWVFNRNRVEKGHPMGEIARFLFRPSGWMLGLYVGLSLLYGYGIHMPGLVDAEVWKRSLLGLVATSALLHFYYDGFIWKVREKTTREGLGLAGGGDSRSTRLHRGWAHGAQWALFVVPLGALAAAQLTGLPSPIERLRNVAEAVPSASTLSNLGDALLEANQPAEAVAALEAALALDPQSARAHQRLGGALLRAGRSDEALAQMRAAVALAPQVARRHEGLGQALAEAGRTDEAIAAYEQARSLDPSDGGPVEKLGALLSATGRVDEALPLLEQTARLRPGSWQAQYNLAGALAAAGRDAEAVTYLERAVALDASAWQAQHALGAALRRVGRTQEGRLHLRRASELRRAAGGGRG